MIKNITIVRSVGAFVLSLLVSGCAVNTTTYGTGKSVESGLGQDLTRIMTFGRVNSEKNRDITYRERSALVIPSQEQLQVLPPPGSARIQAPADGTLVDGQPVTATTGSGTSVTLKELEASQKVPGFKRRNQKSLLGAVGLGKSKSEDLSGNRLIDVPQEYRTVDSSAPAADVDELLGKKKKKKKKFGIF
ncbi:MAG: hypothetical protein H2045_05175 [Rhizobiales bacterium]|nr:hypothetical protein [Hyphomicrobiales bacterium]